MAYGKMWNNRIPAQNNGIPELFIYHARLIATILRYSTMVWRLGKKQF